MSDGIKKTLAELSDGPDRLLLFFGGKLSFPPQLLQMVEGKIEDVRILRLDPCHFETLEQLPGDCCLIFDDAAAPRLISEAKFCACAMLVHAYRDLNIARAVLNGRERPARPIHSLPLHLAASSFVEILRLYLAGHALIPKELLPTEQAVLPAEVPVESEEKAAALQVGDIQLTPRETQILKLVASGERNKTIAHALKLSEHTVKLHIHHIISKISATNRTQAAQWFQTHGAGRTNGEA